MKDSGIRKIAQSSCSATITRAQVAEIARELKKLRTKPIENGRRSSLYKSAPKLHSK